MLRLNHLSDQSRRPQSRERIERTKPVVNLPFGFGHATGRYLAKIVSGAILMLGYVMVAFSRRKQGLHDHLAGTLVINKGAARRAAGPWTRPPAPPA